MRQVRYAKRTLSATLHDFPSHEWIFFILNKPDEIRRIKERINSVFADPGKFSTISLDRDGILTHGRIKSSEGLHYLVYNFYTNKGKINFNEKNRIYKQPRKFKESRDLDIILKRTMYEEETEQWFKEIYIPQITKYKNEDIIILNK